MGPNEARKIAKRLKKSVSPDQGPSDQDCLLMIDLALGAAINLARIAAKLDPDPEGQAEDIKRAGAIEE